MTELTRRLTVAEADVLADCEETISHGLQTFVEVGTALALIRDNRLYRADHDTFEAYCQERWSISRPRAYELMTAAKAVSGMPDNERPANARQAVELARVPEADRAAVWRAANEATDGKPTAAAIRAAATPDSPAGPSAPSVSATEADQPGPDHPFDAGEEPTPGLAAAAAVSEAPTAPTVGAGDEVPAAPSGTGGAAGTNKPNRRPLPDAASNAGWELEKAVERIARIVADDRYPRNAEQVATHLRGHLQRALLTLSEVSERLPKSQLEVTP